MKPLHKNNEKHNVVKIPGASHEDYAFMGQIQYEGIVEVNNARLGDGVAELMAPRSESDRQEYDDELAA
jgi:hypothetical protein